MIDFATFAAAAGSGIIVGTVTGLMGGGGSILSVPLLLYVVGVQSPHLAIGTSALAVALISIINLGWHARAGNVNWKIALLFGGPGILGAVAGTAIAKQIEGFYLVLLLGFVMMGTGILSVCAHDRDLHSPSEKQTRAGILAAGLGTGMLSGLFGVSAGFIIVPVLRFFASVPIFRAVGTSLAIASVFAAAIGLSYALSGFVDWVVAASMVVGGSVGAIFGLIIGLGLSSRKGALELLFGLVIGVTGAYTVLREFIALAY